MLAAPDQQRPSLYNSSQACKEIEAADAAQVEVLHAELRKGPLEAAVAELHRVRAYLDRSSKQVKTKPGSEIDGPHIHIAPHPES